MKIAELFALMDGLAVRLGRELDSGPFFRSLHTDGSGSLGFGIDDVEYTFGFDSIELLMLVLRTVSSFDELVSMSRQESEYV